MPELISIKHMSACISENCTERSGLALNAFMQQILATPCMPCERFDFYVAEMAEEAKVGHGFMV